MANAQTWEAMAPGLVQGGARAHREPAGRFHALAHLLDVPALARASHRQRAEAAVGVAGVTQDASGRHLASHLQDLPSRRKAKRYRPQPIRRVYIPTAQGKTRPLGIAAFEDPVGQDAVREVREAMYAQDFVDGSQGFRPGRTAHDAVRTLKRIGERGEGRWISEADIGSCFDRVDRTALKELRGRRVAEGSRMRLMGTCVHVGGRDGETMVEPERGTAQGAGLSAVVGHGSRHDVLDRWLAIEVQPRLQGKAPLMRSGDDCSLGFAREDEARRVGAVRDKRRERCGLTRHPDKTRRVPFRRPPQAHQPGTGPTTLDFVGVTCYWARSRNGHGWMACKPRRASLRRAKTSIYEGCRRHRHWSIQAQHAALHRRLRGHFHSCGVRGNSNRRMRLVEATKRAGYKWRRRRRQRPRLHWERCTEMLRWWPLPRPRVTVRIWDGSPRATSTEEPEGGNLLVRLWRGAG